MLLKGFCLIIALLGAPLFLVIAALALLGFASTDIELSVVIVEMSRLADTPLLISLPLFIFAGMLLSESQAPQRILALSQVLLGWMPGGLAVVSLGVCALFTAFTGASGITIFALGGLLFPTLIKDGYQEKFSLGLITSAGSLGLLFPPSLPLILYGVVAETRIDQLFVAGLLPGALMLVVFTGYAVYQKRDIPKNSHRPTKEQLICSLRDAVWELPLPILLLGGIYGGFFVVGEAAAVTCLYVLIVETLVYRDIPIKKIPEIMVESMVLFGGILVILAASMALSNYVIDQEIPTRLFAWFHNWIDSKYTFLLLLNVFLLAVGAMLDIFSALMLIVPIILPIAEGYGISPIHLGIIFLTNLQIGYCTPPVGLNLFLASYRFKRPIAELYRATLPFLGLLIITLLIITYVPWLSTVLISSLGN